MREDGEQPPEQSIRPAILRKHLVESLNRDDGLIAVDRLHLPPCGLHHGCRRQRDSCAM